MLRKTKIFIDAVGSRKWTAIFLVVCLVILSKKFQLYKGSSSTKATEFLSMDIPTPPLLIRDMKEAHSLMMKLDNGACTTKEEWGGIPIFIPVMNKAEARAAGNYSICMDEGVRPPNGNCTVYSFGIQNEWSFDEAAEKYGCAVFAFDPSMGNESYGYSKNIAFYPVGLSSFDYIVNNGSKKGWSMLRLSTILKRLKHEKKIIDILKIDIEEDEHIVIPDIVSSGILENVRQVTWELHLFQKMTPEKFYSTYWILERAGFRKFYVEHWNHDLCAHKTATGDVENYCYIFSHLNTKFLHHRM